MNTENISSTTSKNTDDKQPKKSVSSRHSVSNVFHRSGEFWRLVQRRLSLYTFVSLWLPVALRPWFVGYFMAGLLQIVAVIFTALLVHIYPTFNFSGMPALFVVVFVSLSWGVGPGILATLLGSVFLVFFVFPPPYFSLATRTLADGVGIILYLMIGLSIGLIANQTRIIKETASTAQRQGSETVRQQLYDLLKLVPIPISVLGGSDHRFEFVSPFTQQAIGERDVVGQPIREALPEYVEQGIVSFLDQVYTSGETLIIREMRAETIHHSDGLSVPLEQYFNVVYQPIKSEQGTVDAIIIFNINVTEQVQAHKQMERLMLEREQERDQLRMVLMREQELRKVAEDVTRQLETVLDVLPVGVEIADASGHIFQHNTAILRMWGEPTLEVRNIADYERFQGKWVETGKRVAPEEWPLVSALIQGVVSYDKEIDVLTFDGQHKTLLQFASPIRDERGVITGAVTAALDITLRKQLERALQEAEQQALERARYLEAVFEAIADPIFIVSIETGLQRMNYAARELLAIPDAVQTGKLSMHPHFFEIYDEQDQYLPKEAWPQARIFEGNVLYGPAAVDVVMHTHDGRKLNLSVTGAPLRDEKGIVQAAVLVCRDVTERKNLELLLRRTEQQTRESLQALLVLAEALVSVPITGEKGEGAEGSASNLEDVAFQLVVLIRSVLNCKRVSMTIIDTQTHELRSLAVVGLPADLQKLWKERQPGFNLSDQIEGVSLASQFAVGNVAVLDMQSPRFAGQPNPYGIKTMLLSPMRIGTQLIGILAQDHGDEAHVFTDDERTLAKAVAELAALILERERLLEERAESQANMLALQEANYLKDEFIGIAGHELRTPLTTVKASVQLARRQVARLLKLDVGISPDAEKLISTIQTLLDRAERQVGMQNRLVNDLLDVSRIETGRLELHPELSNLEPLIREVVEDQQALTPDRQILLEHSPSDEVLVLVDADRLRQVMTNYLSNALKYSTSDQSVFVRMILVDAEVRVEVEDRGQGLTEAQQQRIWERFYRVPGIEVRSGSGVGLGLGLHISRMIIERHGGKVGVKSVKGQGSTFWLALPLAE